ncbi:MAG: glycosyltransferase family 9 protein [Bacteroidia bacterium]
MNEKILYFKSWLTSRYINLLGDKSYDFKTILIIKMDEIGDLVTALPVFYNLHALYPEAKQTLVCKGFNTIFFKHIDYVDCVTNFDDVNHQQFDLIIDLRGTAETLHYALSIKPKMRLDRGSIRLKNKLSGGQKNEIDTNIEVIAPLLNKNTIWSNKIVTSADEQNKVGTFLDLEGASSFVIMHLGARDEARRWPVERYAKVINHINKAYSMPCILVGGPDDNEANKKCLELVKSKINVNVAGGFDLLEYAALCVRASLFVGNESGPLHIAAAQNTPTIALFGPGVKDVFYPKNDKSIIHHYFLARGHKKQTLANSTIFQIRLDEVIHSVDRQLGKIGH